MTLDGLAGSSLSRYNGFNQLVATETNEKSIEYTYNPAGIRLSKTVDGVTTGFVLDGGDVALETLGGSVVSEYVRGVGLVHAQIGPASNYYLFNGHGDVTGLADSSGVITKTYDYDAFGVERDIDGLDVNPFRYSGEYFDRETGEIYLRARYYSPGIGRFTTEDPARADLNWYTYCNGKVVHEKNNTAETLVGQAF
ncbi:RHS repeat-associated core domain-containing protein [Oscillospiraceae bacterium OttesenSCG-928-G22]|nr:RHS repeat-associated core domain-containing protein [Oscillospiraceae bacterium OttesenSCG-928-G22]